MRIVSADRAGRPIISFPIFYDVPNHSLALDTFIATASEFSNLIEAFNRELFDGQLQYKVYVLPPEAGSFKQRLGVVVISGGTFLAGAIFGAPIGEVSKGFIEGVAGRSLHDWGVELGRDAQRAIQDWIASDETIDASEAIEDEGLKDRMIASCALTNLSERFLEQPTEKIRSLGIDPQDFPGSFSAKNGFYGACELNPLISGVGFDESPGFPIRREDFQRRVTPVRKEEEEDWKFESVRFFVTSPNWDREDRQRGWKGRDSRGGYVFFQLIDQEFWRRFDSGDLKSQNIDEVIGQIAYKVIKGRKLNRIMLNVISYNDEKYSEELSEAKLRSILEDFLQRPIGGGSESLF
jgi:hypothetical protein